METVMSSNRSFRFLGRSLLAAAALGAAWLSVSPAVAEDDPIPTVRRRYQTECRYIDTVPTVRTVCDSRGRCRRQIISTPKRVCTLRRR
jgi:hypothetical protein